MRGSASNDVEELYRLRCVDLVPGIGRLVIVRMEAGEEEQHRYLLSGERRVIGGTVSRRIRLLERERARLADLINERIERSPGTESAQIHLAIANPPDHVHVDHRDGILDRQLRI